MKATVRIRRAQLDEADELSAIAMESKAYWGYSAEFMEACREELLVPAENLTNERFSYCVAETEGKPIGYYALERLSVGEYELEALFVVPARIGTGIGRLLMEHAKEAVAAAGGSRMIIQGDPNAEGFYLAAGGVWIGYRESRSIPGRHLPLFTIHVGRSETDVA